MAKYRKVDTRIHNDEKFMSLCHPGKLLFFTLLTHPGLTSLGAMRCTAFGLAEEMDWIVFDDNGLPKGINEDFSKAFSEIQVKGLVEYDERAKLIAIPNFIKYNKPESPNVVKGWSSAVDMLPECKLKTLVIQRAKDLVEGMTEGFIEAFRKSMPIQEQEQEQEQEYIKTICSVSQSDTKPPAKKSRSKFIPPTVEQVSEYKLERGEKGISIDPHKFVDYYESNGWMRGNTKIKDWKACFRTWESKSSGYSQSPRNPTPPQAQIDQRRPSLIELVNQS